MKSKINLSMSLLLIFVFISSGCSLIRFEQNLSHYDSDQQKQDDEFSVSTEKGKVKLVDWNDKIDPDTIFGKPVSVKNEVLGQNADTYKGSFIETRKYKDIEVELMSPKGNGKTYYIQKMKITGDSCRTARGIIIGSSIQDVLKVYPEAVWADKKDDLNGVLRFRGEDLQYIYFSLKNSKVQSMELVFELG